MPELVANQQHAEFWANVCVIETIDLSLSEFFVLGDAAASQNVPNDTDH